MVRKASQAKFVRLSEQIGWSQRQIAGLVQCDPKTASNWGRGERECPAAILEWLERVAHALRTDLKAPDYNKLRPAAGRRPST